jgi:hypothetical protein
MKTNYVKPVQAGKKWNLLNKIRQYTEWITTESFWFWFALLTVSLVVIASIFWMQDHSFGVNWDEAEYFDRLLADLQRIRDGGILLLAKSLLTEDRIRPPAYRLLTLPFVVLFGFSPFKTRLVSIGFFVVSLLLISLPLKRLATPMAGAIAVLVLVLSPIMIFSIMIFGTEFPLFFAVASTIYFVFKDWGRPQESKYGWIGLGLSLGLGALAKTSFALIAGPMMLILLFEVWRRMIDVPSIQFLLKGVLLGCFIALPWWAYNYRPAIWYSSYAINFERHSLEGSIVHFLPEWMSLFTQSVLGFGTTIILALAVLFLFINRVVKPIQKKTNLKLNAALWLCFLAPMALLLVKILGKNQNMRHIAPAIILFAVGIGLLIEFQQWSHSHILMLSVSMLLGAQLLLTVIPALKPMPYPKDIGLFVRPPWLVMSRYEQWDWKPLYELAESYSINEPSISFLGGASQLNWPSISYPWLLQSEEIKNVNWLWRSEEGVLDWKKVMSVADNSDIVLTASIDPSGEEDIDNKYNAEFEKRLMNDPHFMGPYHLTMGRFEQVDVIVFINKSRIVN